MAKTVKKLTLGPTLGTYAFIFKPRDPPEGSPPGTKQKYGICLVWPKAEKASLQPLQDAIVAVARGTFGLDADGKAVDVVDLLRRGKLKNPLRDGDVERPEDPAFKGCYFANLSSERKPGLVDAKVQPIFEEAEAYSGCTFRATVALFAFNKAGNRGVAIGLNNLQAVEKGPRMDGRKPPEEDFAEFREQERAAVGGVGAADLL
jgi:hypothetical protein